MIKILYDNCYAHPLPEGHRFPMHKYDLIPKQLLHHGVITLEQIIAPTPCPLDIVLETHSKDYIDSLISLQLDAAHIRRIGFPLSPELIYRELMLVQGTIECCNFAFTDGVSLNVAGGTHHAFSNKGEGFCLLNDFAVAANYLLNRKHAKRILIIDLDVHQGNGTAQIFKNNKNVFTFSMHGKNNFPFLKENSSVDIELADYTSDDEYLNLLKQHLPNCIKKHNPDFIFYLSGVDILKSDKLGKLNISANACRMRDRFVFEQCKNYNIPTTVAMGGGYSPNIADIVNAHCATFEEAIGIFS